MSAPPVLAPLHPICSPRCEQHLGHVYVVCYGPPVTVHDRDHLVGELERDYPISHYVGFTSGLPIRRLWTHGAKSSRCVVAIVPGDARREQMIKELEACPSCGQSLWYYGESPRPLRVIQDGDILTRGLHGRVRYLAVGQGDSITEVRRIGSESRHVFSGPALDHARPSFVVRWRKPGSYYDIQEQRQAALRSDPRPEPIVLERLRVEAYRASAD